MNQHLLRLVLASAALSIGCAATPADVDEDSTDSTDGAVTSSEAAAILDLVNDPAVDVGVLDVAAALDARAAKAIVLHRNGADGVYPSADDDAFDTLAELDAIAYVGKAALDHMAAYAAAHASPHAETVEGVKFLGWQSEAVVWGVDHATLAELDDAVGLDARAAKNLIASAPHASVAAMGPLGYVGPTALARLRDHALAWYGEMNDDATCEPTFTPAGQPAVAAYSDGVDAYDPLESWAGFSFGSWTGPTCLDLGDAAQLHALQGVLIQFSEWGYVVADFPDELHYSDVAQGPGAFQAQLDESLAYMKDVRDQRVSEGDPEAQAQYDELAAQHDAVAVLAKAHPEQTYSLSVHFDAEECSQDSSLIIDLATGLVLVAHKGPGC